MLLLLISKNNACIVALSRVPALPLVHWQPVYNVFLLTVNDGVTCSSFSCAMADILCLHCKSSLYLVQILFALTHYSVDTTSHFSASTALHDQFFPYLVKYLKHIYLYITSHKGFSPSVDHLILYEVTWMKGNCINGLF